MAILKDVEVRIARNTSGKVIAEDAGARLREYERPNPISNLFSDSVERYIEAVTGQAFQIEVYIQPSFKFYVASGITVGIEIDDKTINIYKHFARRRVEQNQKAGKPIVISSVTHAAGDRYLRTGFAFGSLHLDESLDVDKDLADSQAETQGRILVTVHRYKSKKLAQPKQPKMTNTYKAGASVDIAKDLYKDRHIRQSVTAGLEVERNAPSLSKYEHTPYHKYNCGKLYFVFRYRDHMGLELLGCHPQEITGNLLAAEPIGIGEISDHSDVESEEADKSEGGDNGEVIGLRAEIKRLQAFERENTDLKQTIEGLKQEKTSMKVMKDQMAALMGSFGDGAPTYQPLTPAVKPEIKREHIKKEPGESRASPSSASRERPAKRSRTYVELD